MGVPPWTLEAWAVAVVAVAAAVDLRTYRIPNGLSAALTLSALVLPPFSSFPDRFLVGLLCGGVLFGARRVGTVALGTPGVGWGDVKIAGALGLLLGWPGVWSLYLGVVVAAVWGVGGRLSGRLAPKARLPLAPFILGGLLLGLYVFPAETLWAWLLNADGA